MRRRKSTFFSVLLLLILTLGWYVLIHQKKNLLGMIDSFPTHAPQQNVLSVETNSNSHCHAILITSADPQAYLPDPNCTPGSFNPDVTQSTIDTTICHQGYTKTIRPPSAYTSALKQQQIAEYGYKDTDMKNYEEDHFIPLELGGNPTDPKNLWPEPHPSLNEKDKVEDYLRRAVCSGSMSLADAQHIIQTNWYQVAIDQHYNY